MIQIFPVTLAGDVKSDIRLSDVILDAVKRNKIDLADNDIVIIAQKIVSKAEGRVVSLRNVVPSKKEQRLAKQLHKDPRIVTLILKESKEVVKMKNGIIITETNHGLVCANSGVDQSNVADSESVVLLPQDPDLSAKKLRKIFRKKTGKDVAVVITDTFGRPFREGQVNIAIGISGIAAIKSYIGKTDMFGRKLHVTEIAVADEVASASELVMNKSDSIPIVVMRGLKYKKDNKASAARLIRPKRNDLFRQCNR